MGQVLGFESSDLGLDERSPTLQLSSSSPSSSPARKSTRQEILDGDINAFSRAHFAQEKKGKVMDNYKMLNELGTGSFGIVNKARDVRNDTLFAIKTLPKHKVKDPQKIKEEFMTIRQLDHPHICKAYECYDDRKNMYLVMELLVGGTLLETLCRQTKFTEADAGSITRQILSALAYLHAANFIFRDLKTENVMFVSQPEPEDQLQDADAGAGGAPRTRRQREIKLIDFGLCCPFDKGSKLCKAAGTPYSVAPELVTSPVQYDQKCDAWSAGVVIFIMLSGKYPFKAKTKNDLLKVIRKEPVSFAHPHWKKISKEGKMMLAELLKKNPAQRLAVTDALMHPWIAHRSMTLTQNILTDVVDSFHHFQDLNMFEKAAVTALAWRANDEDTAHLRDIFRTLDSDGNGHITVQELRSVIEQAGIQIPVDLEQLAVQADTDGGGTIEYTEFLAATLDKQKLIREEVIWEAFRCFDADGSGTITKQELLKILTGESGDKIRQAHGNKAVDNFVDEYDLSGDAVIDFEEFMDMLQGVRQTYTKRKSIALTNGNKPEEFEVTSPPRQNTGSPNDSPRRKPKKSPRSESPRSFRQEAKPPAESEDSLFAQLCFCSMLSKQVAQPVNTGNAPTLVDDSATARKRASRTMLSARSNRSARSSRRGNSPTHQRT